jgi:glycosyltransferase involved in cell wall biosynthesis
VAGRKKILHIITTLSTGGAEMMLLKLISSMDQNAFESKVISLTDIGPVGEKIQELGVSVYGLGMRHGLPSPLSLAKLVSRAGQDRPHLIQTWMYHADLLGLLLARLFRHCKLVWNIRCSDVPFNNYRPRTGWIVALCSRLSSLPDTIVFNSRAGIRQHMNLGYHSAYMQVIPNGFDLDLLRPDSDARFSVCRELGLPEDAIILGLVGRWDPLKDHATFLQAGALIAREEQESVCFVLVGTGMEWKTPELASLIKDVGLQDRVLLLGHRVDIPRLTAAFDIACSTSITEGFPNTIGEAMSCGVPCVVTDVGDSAAIIGDSGRVVPAGDPIAFAEACRHLLSLGINGRRELGTKARKLIGAHYALPDIALMYSTLYDNLVSGDREA